MEGHLPENTADGSASQRQEKPPVYAERTVGIEVSQGIRDFTGFELTISVDYGNKQGSRLS